MTATISATHQCNGWCRGTHHTELVYVRLHGAVDDAAAVGLAVAVLRAAYRRCGVELDRVWRAGEAPPLAAIAPAGRHVLVGQPTEEGTPYLVAFQLTGERSGPRPGAAGGGGAGGRGRCSAASA